MLHSVCFRLIQFFLFFFYEIVMFVSPLLSSPCTSRTPFPTMHQKLKKTIHSRLVLVLGENKRPIRRGRFCVYVFISVLSTCSPKVWSIGFNEVTRVAFVFFFSFYCLRGEWTLLLLDFEGQTHRPSCVHTDTYETSVQKKSLKKEAVVFVQILFFLSRQKILTLNEVDKE